MYGISEHSKRPDKRHQRCFLYRYPVISLEISSKPGMAPKQAIAIAVSAWQITVVILFDKFHSMVVGNKKSGARRGRAGRSVPSRKASVVPKPR